MSEAIKSGHNGGDVEQTLAFIDALVENREAKAGVDSAYWSSALVMAAQRALETGDTIKVQEFIRGFTQNKCSEDF